MSHCKETMTSRERLLTALDHREPDRVPIDLGGNQTGIHRVAYEELIRYLGMDDPVEIMDAVQQLARPCERLLERLRVDTRYISAGAAGDWKGGIVSAERDGQQWLDLVDEFGVRWSSSESSPLYMDITDHPMATVTLADVANYPWPKGDDPGRFAGLRERALKIRNETPYAVVSGISGVVYETCWYLRGLPRWFQDMIEQPEFCEAMLDQTLKFWMDWFRVFLDEVGDLVDVIMIGDDLAGQTGPLFSPTFYHTIVKPRHKQLAQYIRSRTSAKLWYHTCGACQKYLPELIDNGVQIFNPVQISARGMGPAVIKRDFGQKLVLWGGAIDSQKILPIATPQQVREEVRKNLEIWKPGGGYVFNNVHNIQTGVPAENIVAMYDAAYEFGFYA
ncbi:MAG: uroporphyrinogen decarboxylase family protein [Thermoguttaceae bacterium]|nr:uroporphyrinogen decarboxylase family protein [Thermoguttaceae bacterium]